MRRTPALVAALVAVAPAGGTASTTTAAPRDLEATLASALRAPGIDPRNAAAIAVDLRTGQTVYSSNRWPLAPSGLGREAPRLVRSAPRPRPALSLPYRGRRRRGTLGPRLETATSGSSASATRRSTAPTSTGSRASSPQPASRASRGACSATTRTSTGGATGSVGSRATSGSSRGRSRRCPSQACGSRA